MQRVAVVLVLSIAACGGKIEETAPTSATATNAPQGEDGCGLACGRIHVTCTRHADGVDDCTKYCRKDFADERAAQSYASCIGALSCAEIARGIAMDFGPLGECYARARGR